MKKQKIILGRRELVDFPELNLIGVIAKMDTGAYRGTLHCSDFKIVQRNGVKYVKFVPLDPTHENFQHAPVLLKKYGRAWVKASTGHNQKRYYIETTIMIKGEEYPIEVTLSNRNTMRNPVLIGRKFLRKKFLIDVDQIDEKAGRIMKKGGSQ